MTFESKKFTKLKTREHHSRLRHLPFKPQNTILQHIFAKKKTKHDSPELLPRLSFKRSEIKYQEPHFLFYNDIQVMLL